MTEVVNNAVIGKGIHLEGDVTILGSLVVKGTLKGKLIVVGTLNLEEGGTIDGEIITKTAEVNGTIHGDLTATNSASLGPRATLLGNLFTAKVSFSEGSKFNGKCTMIKRKELLVDLKTKKVDLIDLSPEEIIVQG